MYFDLIKEYFIVCFQYRSSLCAKELQTVSKSKFGDIYVIETSIQFMNDKLGDLCQLKPEIQPILNLVTKLQYKSMKLCRGVRTL